MLRGATSHSNHHVFPTSVDKQAITLPCRELPETDMTTFQVGNHSFEWTDLHLSKSDLQPLRHRYDHLGHDSVTILQELGKNLKMDKTSDHRIDLFSVLRDNQSKSPVLGRLWHELNEVPKWVDWRQIQRGQRFLYRYAPGNLMGFALQSFMGENSSAAGVVEVLVRTGGFSTRKLLGRLLETFQFLLQVTESLEAIQPGGSGHTTAVRVRLIHSCVRTRILKLAEKRPGYFDTDKYGVPVNDLDSVHSIALFCCNHTWLHLSQIGIYPSEAETADYVALFRYVGYILGCPNEFFATAARAKATMESMLLHECQITPASHVVAHNFIQCLTDLPPLNLSSDFIEVGSRKLNGDEFCDSLGLGKPGLYTYACFDGFCFVARCLVRLQACNARFDSFMIAYMQRGLNQIVIQSRSEAPGGPKLGFQYVPHLDQKTEKEDNRRQRRGALSRPFEIALFILFCTHLLSYAMPLSVLAAFLFHFLL